MLGMVMMKVFILKMMKMIKLRMMKMCLISEAGVFGVPVV